MRKDRKHLKRLLSLIEWLFHSLPNENLEFDELVSAFKNKLLVICQSEDIGNQLSDVQNELIKLIKKDTELSYTLNDRFGSGSVKKLHELLSAH